MIVSKDGNVRVSIYINDKEFTGNEYLKDMKYEVPFDITVVDFDDDKVMGQADMENKKIFITATTFDAGRREIAMTIMEECEHIRSKYPDETRAFETHIFSQ